MTPGELVLVHDGLERRAVEGSRVAEQRQEREFGGAHQVHASAKLGALDAGARRYLGK